MIEARLAQPERNAEMNFDHINSLTGDVASSARDHRPERSAVLTTSK